MLETPVLFLVFNRPEHTKCVFDAIKLVQPQQLFIAADGPRDNNKGEREKCAQVREIVSQVDWPCQVQTLFREKNLGCKYAVSSAISWFFEQVEQGIVLEDDTLPEQSFFRFCEELLAYYKDQESIMHITGTNFQFGTERGRATYYFSNYPHIWGWASWRRAWKNYDLEMSQFQRFLDENKINRITQHSKEKGYWLNMFTSVYKNEIDTWDYQWRYSMWNAGGLAIVPNTNLITNIGFGEDSTHTYQKEAPTANMPVGSIDQIIHPQKMSVDRKADFAAYKNAYNPPVTFINQVRNFTYKYFPKSFVAYVRKLRRIILPV